MRERVACLRCGAHWDRAIAEVCGVCLCPDAAPVLPTLADVDLAIARTASELWSWIALRQTLQGHPAARPH